MKSRWLLNLVLLLAVLGLATFVYVSQKKQQQVATLTLVDKASISSITIPRSEKNIILKKSSDGWKMISPYVMKAHDFRVNRLLELLNVAVEKHYDIVGLDLKKYDLEPPRSEIQFDSIVIQYGKTNPVNQKRYVRVDNSLYMISDDLYPLISAEPSSFVDVSVLPAQGEILSLQLPSLELVRQQDKTWKNGKGEIIEADRIQGLLENWVHAQAFGVHAFLKRDKSRVINIGFADGTKIEFEISQDASWLILGRKDLGVEYHLASNQASELLELKSVKQEL